MPLTMQEQEYVMGIEQMLFDSNSDAILLDGFEKALIGCVKLWNGKSVGVYDVHSILELLVHNYNMSMQDASSYFQSNIESKYMGESSPLFLFHPDRNEKMAAWS